MKRLLLLSAIVAAALVMGACSSDDDTVASVSLPSGGTLTGTWALSCSPDEDDPLDGATVSVTFATSSDTGTFDVWFGDLTCTGTSDVTFAFGETFVLGSTVTTAGGITASQIDFTATSETATANTTEGATALSAFLGVTVTVGTPVDTFDAASVVVEKDIFAISTTPDPDQLFIGVSATAPAGGYPTALDPNFVLERQ